MRRRVFEERIIKRGSTDFRLTKRSIATKMILRGNKAKLMLVSCRLDGLCQ
jgi:hypothetical protein